MVIYNEGTLADIRSWLDREIPVIVFVQAKELPVWRGQDFKHTVVVVGLDGKTILRRQPKYSCGRPLVWFCRSIEKDTGKLYLEQATADLCN